MSDWYETMKADITWTVREATSSLELAELAESLENEGWTIRTISTENLVVLASKKVDRLDD